MSSQLTCCIVVAFHFALDYKLHHSYNNDKFFFQKNISTDITMIDNVLDFIIHEIDSYWYHWIDYVLFFYRDQFYEF